MRILLFGSTGMVGTAVESACKGRDIEYIGLDHNDVDITDFDAVRKTIDRYSPDVIVNSVAIIGINICETNPVRAFDVNAIAVYNMARYSGDRDITFVQPSSHAVFDGTKEGYYTEQDIPRPINIYSMTKYVSEIFAMNLCRKHYIVRFPTMFGARRNRSPGFVDKVINNIERGERLKIADDKIDSMTYALDAAEGLVSILEDKAPYGIYHLANSGMVSYYGFVKRLIELLKADVELVKAKDEDFPALGYKPLKTAMRSVKLVPMRTWEDALHDYVSNYLR